jgi:hypothetical protein
MLASVKSPFTRARPTPLLVVTPVEILSTRLAARSRCGRLSLRRWESTMHAPERWPFGDIESWWAWRDHLDRVQDLNIATLKREADCEIARILRCCESRWGPKRPARLVPGRVGVVRG